MALRHTGIGEAAKNFASLTPGLITRLQRGIFENRVNI
jgi:hypothetical protein